MSFSKGFHGGFDLSFLQLSGFIPVPVERCAVVLNGTDQYWKLSEDVVIPADTDFSITFNLRGTNDDSFEGLMGGTKSFLRFLNRSQGVNLQMLLDTGYVSILPYTEDNLRDGKIRKLTISREDNKIYSQIDDGLIDLEATGRGGSYTIFNFGKYSTSFFGGMLYGLSISIAGTEIINIPLTNKTEGSVQMPIVGDVYATLMGSSDIVWDCSITSTSPTLRPSTIVPPQPSSSNTWDDNGNWEDSSDWSE